MRTSGLNAVNLNHGPCSEVPTYQEAMGLGFRVKTHPSPSSQVPSSHHVAAKKASLVPGVRTATCHLQQGRTSVGAKENRNHLRETLKATLYTQCPWNPNSLNSAEGVKVQGICRLLMPVRAAVLETPPKLEASSALTSKP